MQIPRLFADTTPIDDDASTILLLDKQQVSRLITVLRLRAGDRVDILDGRGRIYHCSIENAEVNRGRCELKVESSADCQGEPSIKITLALPLIKAARFEWAIEKLTELGISTIIPMQTERSVVRFEEKSAKGSATANDEPAKLIRWRSIAREAAEQCERSLIPNVVRPKSFSEIIDQAKESKQQLLICAERRKAEALTTLLAKRLIKDPLASLVVLVGPEGGFTENEFDIAEKAGALAVTLGKRILRSETAAVYTASILMDHLDK